MAFILSFPDPVYLEGSIRFRVLFMVGSGVGLFFARFFDGSGELGNLNPVLQP